MVMARPCIKDVRTSCRSSLVENLISRSGKSALLVLLMEVFMYNIGRTDLS
jgi:hypothetical protein